MNCWHCNTELIWGGDQELDEHLYGKNYEYDFSTNLSCPKCKASVEVLHHKESLTDKNT